MGYPVCGILADSRDRASVELRRAVLHAKVLRFTRILCKRKVLTSRYRATSIRECAGARPRRVLRLVQDRCMRRGLRRFNTGFGECLPANSPLFSFCVRFEMEMKYRAEATTLEGFIQQLAVGYVCRGYRFYFQGLIPAGKDPRAVDAKLIARYGSGPQNSSGLVARHRASPTCSTSVSDSTSC